jgi:hypothetical protein
MIYVNGNKEVTEIKALGKVIYYVYHGAILVWEYIRSCFGSGKWIGVKPWIGTDAWKGNDGF